MTLDEQIFLTTLEDFFLLLFITGNSDLIVFQYLEIGRCWT